MTSRPVSGSSPSLRVAVSPSAEAVMARAGTENFPVASRLLGATEREHLLAVYGFARLVGAAIDLGAIAGGKYCRFLDRRAADQVAQGRSQRFHLERDSLPHLDRRSRVIEAKGVERHRAGLIGITSP